MPPTTWIFIVLIAGPGGHHTVPTQFGPFVTLEECRQVGYDLTQDDRFLTPAAKQARLNQEQRRRERAMQEELTARPWKPNERERYVTLGHQEHMIIGLLGEDHTPRVTGWGSTSRAPLAIYYKGCLRSR